MPLMLACIAPHGGGVLPQLAEGAQAQWQRIRGALQELGRRLRRLQPDALVVLTPHGPQVPGRVSISVGSWAEGRLGPGLRFGLGLDGGAGRQLLHHAARRDLPVSPASRLELDWGVTVPVTLLAPAPPAIVLSPAADLSRPTAWRLGWAIAGWAGSSGRRVALLASADLAHAHDPRGPYGFDPAAAAFDQWLCAAVAQEEPDRLLDLDAQVLERAKPDCTAQVLALAGALRLSSLQGHALRGELLTYGVPTYFGMLCAVYA